MLAASLIAGPMVAEAQDGGVREAWAWVHAANGPMSYRIASEGGRVRVEEERRGVHVAVERRGVWTRPPTVEVRVIEVRMPAWRCNSSPAPGEPMEVEDPTSQIVTRRLEVVRDGTAHVLLPADMEVAAYNELDDQIRVLATVGPYLFVERLVWCLPLCGTHGYAAAQRRVFDLRTLEEVDLLAELPPAPAALAHACARLQGAVSAALLSTDSAYATDCRLAGLTPRLRGGHFEVLYHLSRAAPYAVGGPRYAIESQFRGGRLGPRFARHDVLPDIVRRFLGGRTHVVFGGFSVVS